MLNTFKWTGIVLVGLVVLGLLGQRLAGGTDSEAPTFSEFLDRLDSGEVASITLVPSRQEIEVEPSGRADSSDEYQVAYPADYAASLVADVRDKGVPIDVNSSSGWTFFYYLAPLALFVAFWVWLARRLPRFSGRAGGGDPDRD